MFGFALALAAWPGVSRAQRGAPAETLLAPAELPPPEPRQFRAAWVATVANIDWPSRPGLTAWQQQVEARAILDRARSLGLNALVLQVRPAGDALYPSRLEPWSEYLSGRQGIPPRPWWDPLAFWVREAHRRGLQLHAWFNPFRARHPSAKTPLVKPHLALRAPASVKAYGDLLWMDPGDAVARTHTLAVIEDVLRRYDVDGVHIDDYFYPYPVVQDGSDLAFPDSEAYLRYLGEGGMLPLPDWRRAHVDALVQALHERVRRTKPGVLLGISPFGLGRPERRSPGITGFSQYDKLFADVERWLEEGWLDYLAPQLYWPIASEGQPFAPLLQYWARTNVRQRHLWPGLFTSSVRSPAMPVPPAPPPTPFAAMSPPGDAAAAGATRIAPTWPAREVLEQLAILDRQAQALGSGTAGGLGGHIHFSMSALMQDRDGLAAQLQRGPYAVPALVPATRWLDDRPPPPPLLTRRGEWLLVEPGRGEAPALYAVWRRIDGRWRFGVVTVGERRLARERADAIVVAAVDRHGNASARQAVRWP
ncbi:MAG: family 10 glycosylhydrolase [Burkholderiales bacterium]|nr:family 10 glycosylhydrolase [Burkholderiales bacterium]